MKRKLLLLLALMAIGLSGAWAYDFSAVAPSGQTLYYNIVGGNAQVSGSPGYPKLTGALVIPATVTYNSTTYSVTTIGTSAFYDCDVLTSVTIPNSVTSIGSYAFYGCSGLTSVTIGNSVTTIGNEAFFFCSGLTSVTIPNSVTTIGTYAFDGCSGLTSVTIPNSVTTIGNYAFANCSGLTSVTIPNSVTSIGNSAFHGCSNVDTLYYNARSLPATSYFSGYFQSMKLKYLVIGDSVRSLPSYVFYGQDSLTSVTIPNLVTSIERSAFAGCSGLTSVTIPNSVTTIGNYAFANCSGLTSVTIPNSVTSIGDYAFDYCSGLTSVTIPNSVTSIGDGAFRGCSNVDTLYYNARSLPATSSYFGYFHSMKLKHLLIGDSVQTLPNYVFYNQDSLTSVTMEGATPPTLGSDVFYGNASNRKIYVPCGAYETYYNATNGWSTYRSALSDPIVDIDVVLATEAERGSVVIVPLRGQEVRCDSTVVVTVTSTNYGYHFDHWSTGSIEAQDTIFIERDTVITAYFTKNQYAINVVSGNVDRGSVLGSDTIDYLDSTTISAIANYGYHFTRWNDNDTHSVRTIQVTQNETYTAYFDFNQYQLTVTSANLAQGSFSGSGTYDYLSNRTISATANYGYHFAHWSDGSNENPRTILLTQDTIITAVFAKNQYAVNVVSSDTVRGYVTGSDTIDYLDSITISAVANYGYHFTRWNDNDTHQVRTVQVTQNKTYTAYFDYNQYQLTVASANTIEGSVSGSGTYDYLSNRTISATANYGYHFAHWSDGSNENPRTILLTQDTIITAVFAKNQYAVNVVSSDTVRGYVTGSDTIDYLDSITISAVANYGYHFTRWNDNDTHQVRTVQVTQNKIYTAYFDYNQYQLTVASANTIEGSVSGSGTYDYLSNRTISATANYGYHFAHWSDGSNENPRTILLTQDTIITAEFAKNQYAVNVVSSDTVRGYVTGSDTIDYLDIITISAVANYGYHFTRWNDNDTHQVRTVQVTQNKTYTAYFDYNQYQLTVASADTVQGTCSGSGAYSYLANRTIQANANYGYHFTQWSDGNTDNPRIIQLTQDTLFTAEFAKNQYAITLLSDDESMGSVNGGGTFDYLDTIALAATATAAHHHFVRWNDGNRENPRQWVVTSDSTLTAYFAIDTHSVTVVSNDPTRGMVTSSGSEFAYLNPCTVTATAYTGFVFTGWSNGVTANPYTFAVQSDVELTAIFVSEDELMFTITVETDDPTMGSVSGGGMAMSGGEVTIHAVANEGYHFVRWNDNDTNADRTVIVTEDATYTAYFASDQTEGIDKVEQMPTIVVRGNSVAVGNAQGQKLSIYDITGRMIVREQAVDGKQYTMPHTGVYMVQVGNRPAEKVVVIR